MYRTPTKRCNPGALCGEKTKKVRSYVLTYGVRTHFKFHIFQNRLLQMYVTVKVEPVTGPKVKKHFCKRTRLKEVNVKDV